MTIDQWIDDCYWMQDPRINEPLIHAYTRDGVDAETLIDLVTD